MQVAILYQRTTLPPDHADYASEIGVLASVRAIAAALEAAGHHAWEVTVAASAAELIAALENRPPDVVLNLCEGFAGQSRYEPHVAGLLELLGVPYTGSSPECLSLVRDKARTKRLLVAAHLRTPEFFRVPRGGEIPRESIAAALATGPLIVKPASEDASLGIGQHSVVTDLDEAARQIAALQERFGDVLVERYIDGREFNVGIIALGEPRALPLAEIEFRDEQAVRWRLVTYESKWSPGSSGDRATPVRCPAEVEPALAERLRGTALAAFRATGCRDYARVDLRVSATGEVFILEVNANPDLSPTAAGFALALNASGTEYGEFIDRLIRAAAQRKSDFGNRKSEQAPPTSDLRPPTSNGVVLRPFRTDDREPLLTILRDCEMFRPDEVDVADEILVETIRDGDAADYRIVVAEESGRPVGWSCFGRVPLTDASYDLYWIAVDPQRQRTGIGRQLLADCEDRLRAAGARWLLAETSSTPLYDATRAFYSRCGFQVVTNIPEFYRAGDGLTTYAKRLNSG